MRPKGVLGLFVVILLVVGVTYLISDDLIETGMERSGESIIGARVEIDNLKFSLVDLAISFDRLQVTNPNDTWKNVFETGKMSFNMEWAPLAAGKVIINDISVADIRLGTKRETDGKLRGSDGETESGWVGRAKNSLKEKIASAPILNLAILKRTVNLDSLLATFDVQSLRRLDSIKSQADSTQEKWKTVIAEFDPKRDLEKIGQEIQEIKPQEIKGVADLVSTFEKTKRIYSSLNNFKKEIGAKKTQASTDFKRLISSVSSVDKWIARDFDSIKSKANLGEFSPQNIGTMIFGESIIEPIINMLPYIDLIREYMPVVEKLAAANRVESPPRFVGQDIRFPIENAQPDFLIEKVKISGATNQEDTTRVLRLRGEATGITSHPRRYGKPLTFALAAQFPQSNTYEISGEIDHSQETPREQFKVKAAGFQIGSVALSPRPYLPSVVNVKSADISTVLSLNGDDFDFQLEFSARPVTFGFTDSLLKDDAISKVITSVFRSVDLLKVSTRIHGRIDDLDLAISTNIDNILANRIKGVIGASAKVARGKIRKKLDAIVEPKKQEVLGIVNSYRNRTDAEINKIAGGINEKLAVIDQRKKEIEDKIKKEKEKGIKGLTKKLTDIIKN